MGTKTDLIKIRNELKKIKAYQQLITMMEYIKDWNRVLEVLIDLKIIDPKGLGINLTISPGEVKEFYLPLPEGYVCMCPFVELESSIRKVYFTFIFNPKELMQKASRKIRIPDYFIDAPTNLINYEIPTQRVTKSIRLIPKWSVYLKFENKDSVNSAEVYFYIPFWCMKEEHAVNLWFGIFEKGNSILKKISIEGKSFEEIIEDVIKNE